MMMQTYLRRGRRSLERMMLDPKLRSAGAVAAFGGSGFFLSAAGLHGAPQPIAMGLICAATGWRALVTSLGAMVGYAAFWGQPGLQGIVWSAVAGVLALLLGKQEEPREQPLMIPALGAFFTAVTGLSFHFLLQEPLSPGLYALRIALTFGSAVLFSQEARCRDPLADWLVGGVVSLSVSSAVPALGVALAGLLSVGGAFPAAALAGLGLDLAGFTPVPMTAVLCLAWFIRMIPFDQKWQHYAAPGFSGIAIMAACDTWDVPVLPTLFLGGALGVLLPPQPSIPRRRGETGAAQVRLELGAEVMAALSELLPREEAPIDEGAFLEKAKVRACASCSARKTCQEQEKLTLYHLEHPLDADCRKQGRLVPQLRRAREELRQCKADRRRQQEYRAAVKQQYSFLGDYLRTLADGLPRKSAGHLPAFAIEAAARSREKEGISGDRCLAFSGPGCSYYVLLCDGMGTGLGAAREGQEAAKLLKSMLIAGFPPGNSLESLNSLLALRGSAGAVTVDLARIDLETGIARIFKWGAAPSWVLTRGKLEKIGTATPPPGLSVEKTRETVEKLSLRRGEVLMLLSDGADGEECLRLSDLSPDMPPGELAAKILEKSCGKEDDATAAVIRLRPLPTAPS